MKIRWIRSKWDFPDTPLHEFLHRIHAAGFDGSEIYLPSLRDAPEEVVRMHADLNLTLVGMISSEGKDVSEHLRMLEENFQNAIRFAPSRINCHVGKDWFSVQDNTRLIRRGVELSERHGIPISFETHRGRATFSTLSTAALLEAVPAMRLTADFSHWCCVHESLLADQQEAVDHAIHHADYIHARVGHIEGPQVSDPRAPEWELELETHATWWERIVRARRREGVTEFAICPEFGPWPYMPSLPYTRQPVVALWEVNLAVRDLLASRLGSEELAQ
jgi:sugar phosphate isomerase/epimerase